MKVKYSPCKSDRDTSIEYIDENSIQIDGELYEFDEASVEWPDVYNQTSGIIHEAYRDVNGELCLKVLRLYTKDLSWDTGDYHAIGR